MTSESLINTGMGDPEEPKRIVAAEKAEKLKAAQDVLDNFIKKDRILDQARLDRESEKFDDWMRSDSLKKFVEAAWAVFSGVDDRDRNHFVGWITRIQDAFDVSDITASVKPEAYLYEVKLHIRCSDGKLYDYTRRYDKEEFRLMETFSDKKLYFFKLFFGYEDMRRIGDFAIEVKLKHPFNTYDRSEEDYEKDRVTPVSEMPDPVKMDHDEFESLCRQMDKEAASGKSLKDCATEGNLRAESVRSGHCGRWRRVYA